MKNLQITSDGTWALKHDVSGDAGDRSILYVSGEFGSADAVLQYRNGFGDFTNLEEGILETGKQYYIEPGQGVTLYIKVSNSDGLTNIDLIIAGIS